MKKYRIAYLDAFTSKPFSGNPCAVLPQAEGLSGDQMQKIASETNLSETAFVLPSQRADVRVRYFMPRKEIPFAGHPTIATAFLLALEGMVPVAETVSRIDFEFAIGVLPVEIRWDGAGRPTQAVMTQKRPSFGARAEPRALSGCLGLAENDFLPAVPIQVVDTGVPFLVVPVTRMDGLRRARMDRAALASYLKGFGVDGAYLFCLGGLEEGSDFHGRLLSPEGSAEDPFTGSAAGCAGAYIVRYGLRPGPELRAEQGHLIGRPGRGCITVTGTGGLIDAVLVGGAAVKTLDGYVHVSSAFHTSGRTRQ
jgi:trans-2,3-dihydro-3-hydroxyanthranilate isomerase